MTPSPWPPARLTATPESAHRDAAALVQDNAELVTELAEEEVELAEEAE